MCRLQTISSAAWLTASQNKNLRINKPAHLYLMSSKISQKPTNIMPPRRKNLAEVANVVSPEHLTIILAAAVQPTLQLVLPPGQVSPLLAPPPTPKTSSTPSDRKELIQFCKNTILPDPSHSAFDKFDERTPTRVLAAAVYCTLEKHLFDDTTPCADVASKF